MIITPDGPRGPAEVMPMGPALLAARRRAPGAFWWAGGRGRRSRLKSWDRARIPLPFGRGAVVLEGPLSPPDAARGDAGGGPRRLAGAAERRPGPGRGAAGGEARAR